MRITRNPAQWQTIFNEQKTSGLTVIDYCRKHQLSTSSFYLFRKKLGLSTSNFVRTKITQQVEVIAHQHPIELSFAQATLTFPSGTSATYLGQVLRALV